ncbi:ATP-binding protein [Bdellovibrio bacteriovorus]|uniref:sensor histidine kinase n=1 Tax=Bdellovibrio bacteriovorus TaxID=959 RepID=UPI0021D07CE7|nr:ATP-binding protein [Bdellovibrio bacteriovorus]UXR65951.1 ATP-binding protein [Bdellovibrio bacteriovorus]
MVPSSRFALVLIFGFLVSASAVYTALQQKTLPQSLSVGDQINTNSGSITLEATDLIPEPGDLGKKADLARFFERQDLILAASADLGFPDRKLADLPALFWLQIFVGMGSLIISGSIWALRPRDLASGLFAFSGLSTFISAVPSAVYTTRELAIHSNVFIVLEAFNALGACLFGVSILALFMIYPVRLRFWRQMALAQAVFFIAWVGLYLLNVLPDWANVSLMIAVEMLTICIAIGAQFFATKKDPTSRASLTWLGLSVLIGAGAWVIFNTLPLLMKMQPLNQGYAFSFFLIIYLGLAAGLTKYRLFEVGQWAFRFLFYAVGAMILVALDAALIYVLGMERLPALGLALLAIGFVYLPLRDSLWRLFSKKQRLETHELLAESLHVAFAPSVPQREERWQNLLRKLFDPLELKPAIGETREVEIKKDGLTLILPAVASAPAMELSYPWSGTSLFNSSSKDLAREIVHLIEEAESSRQAYDRGVAEERRRMAQDLHDDVGARLLTGLYMADDNLRPTLQGAISDIRSIVSGIAGEKVMLMRLLADLRHETERRLTAVNIELDWPVFEGPQSENLLDYRQHKAMGSALREVISNVIRHAEAEKVRVLIEAQGESLIILIEDDGKGIGSAAESETRNSGFGMGSLQRRLEDIGGRFHVNSSGKGTQISLTIPFDLS